MSPAAEEIIALHAEFERWLRGEGPDDFTRIEASLASDFTFVTPGGDAVDRPALLAGLHASRGTRDIRIRIENPKVRWSQDDSLLATYEEWHDHADYTTSRRSTVLFTVNDAAPGGLLWRHVHETWMTPPPTS